MSDSEKPRVRALSYRPQVKGLFWLLSYICPALAYDSLQAFGDKMVLRKAGAETEVPYSQVERVKLRYMPYLFGWFTLVLRSGDRYTFTSALERNDYLLDALATARPGLVPVSELEKFRRALVAMDHSWARGQASAAGYIRLLSLYFVVPLLLAAFSWRSGGMWIPLDRAIVLAVVNMAIGFTVWIGWDVWLQWRTVQKLRVNPLQMIRDMSFESRVARWRDAVHVLLISGFFLLALR